MLVPRKRRDGGEIRFQPLDELAREFQDVMKNLTKAQKITVSFETTTTTIKQRAFCRCNRTPPRLIVLYSLALTFCVYLFLRANDRNGYARRTSRRLSGDTCRVEVAEELDDEEAERDEKSQRDEPAGSWSEIKGEKKKSLRFSTGGVVKLTSTKEAQKITSAKSIPLGNHFEHFASHCDVGDEIFITPLIGNNNDKSAKLIVRNVERETVMRSATEI